MLGFMERSTIKLLEKRGANKTEIAKVLRRDRKTVRRALQEPTHRQQKRSPRESVVDPYEAQIRDWLEEALPVNVMLHKARELETNPYQGGRTAFYEGVGRIRKRVVRDSQKAIWRFETLPGEYLQSLPPGNWGWIGTRSRRCLSHNLPKRSATALSHV